MYRVGHIKLPNFKRIAKKEKKVSEGGNTA